VDLDLARVQTVKSWPETMDLFTCRVRIDFNE
jgi:hypothetical protein